MSQVKLLTAETLHPEAIDSAQLAVVDFFATGCQPCRELSPLISQLADRYAGRVTVGKLDVAEDVQTATRFRIAQVPVVIFFRDGQEIERLVGLPSEQELHEAMTRLCEHTSET